MMKQFSLYLLAISIILLSGCGTFHNEPKETETTRPQNVVSLAPSVPPITASPSLTSTSATATVLVTTPRPTYTAVSSTPTPYPTLLSEERAKYHMGMLTKSDCELPCFWGIVPGSTTEMQMWDIFLPVYGSSTNSRITSWDTNQIVFDIYTTTLEEELIPPNARLAITLNEQNIVDTLTFDPIRLHAQPTDIFYDPALDQAIQRYAMSQVLSTLGQPSRVFIDLQAGPIEKGAPWLYGIWLIYDTSGVAILYTYDTIGMGMDDQGLHVCPQDRALADMDIFVQSEGLDELVRELLERYSSESWGNQKDIHNLEDATGLTLESFYELFNKQDNNSCFTSPADIWY